jgi:hypothetical protein
MPFDDVFELFDERLGSKREQRFQVFHLFGFLFGGQEHEFQAVDFVEHGQIRLLRRFELLEPENRVLNFLFHVLKKKLQLVPKKIPLHRKPARVVQRNVSEQIESFADFPVEFVRVAQALEMRR